MGAEFEGLKFMGEGDQSMGERMVEVAMALMRKVDDRLERMESKLDEIAKERREEAREHGGLEVRVATLEGHYKRQQGILCTIIGAVLLSILGFLARLAISHPDAVPK